MPAAYYLILPGGVEQSGALHRDALRAVVATTAAPGSAEEVMAMTRRRLVAWAARIMIVATYALSAATTTPITTRRRRCTLIARDLDAAYRSVDVLVPPTTPTTASSAGWKGGRSAGDVRNSTCARCRWNLAGHGMSVPSGFPGRRSPVGRSWRRPTTGLPGSAMRPPAAR